MIRYNQALIPERPPTCPRKDDLFSRLPKDTGSTIPDEYSEPDTDYPIKSILKLAMTLHYLVTDFYPMPIINLWE
jgi:hypothetical protein